LRPPGNLDSILQNEGWEPSDVRRELLIFACALALFGVVGIVTLTRRAESQPAPAVATSPPRQVQAEVRTVGVWRPPAGLQQIPIWPSGAPDMGGASQPPESVLTVQDRNARSGATSQAVFDVATPTMTVFPPRGRNTGAAMIVFPGGGFQAVVLTLEGTEICDWLTAQGITCVLLKYRVPRSNHYRDEACRCGVTPRTPRALQDAQRTVRLVRSRAAELHIDPGRIGVIGFSAGGYMVAQVSNIFAPAYASVDAVDRISSRPDFAIAVYPGHLCRGSGTLDPSLHVTARTPPTFLLQAWDDPVDPVCNSTVYARALNAAGVPSEVHLFARGGHAFGLRRTEHPVAIWSTLVERWLREVRVLRS
jgi:acetyl esterase/lipase